ncbi:MAG: hypothetical protein BroJett010_02530 [Gammaproteobacteria bacterium]|nr:MAG: hypothetical protein BroJett010_02530 [Gammaproteobacteria bacterium]
MHEEIKELDAGRLRQFGLTTGGILAALFGLVFPWLLARPVPRWPWVIAAVLVIWALAAPASLRPVYRGWMRLGLLLGKVTTPLIMGVVFFLVVTPMGIARRLLGKDTLARSFDAAASYRLPSHRGKAKDLENPF